MRNRLVLPVDLDGEPSSLSISRQYLHHFHQINPCYCTLRLHERQHVFSGLFCLRGFPAWCVRWGRLCKEIYLAFAAGQLGTLLSPPPGTGCQLSASLRNFLFLGFRLELQF